MAKKKKISVKDIIKKKKPQQKRHHITQEEYLEHLITVSERSVTSQGSSIDEFFQQQANRLRKELEELRKSK
jgi:disulfide oxidoreductase YuzD